MAVSIDRVYGTVITIVNKEGLAYITPQEFNLYANQAQIEIFESYFSQRNLVPTNDSEYSDIRKNIENKISNFENEETISPSTFSNAEGNTTSSYYAFPSNFYRLGSISASNITVEETNSKKVNYLNRSPLSKPTITSPVYLNHEGGVVIYPTTGILDILIQYVRKPIDCKWAIAEDNRVDFELHPSEFPELVAKILAYIGVTINRADIAQFAQNEEAQIANTQQ